MPRWANFRRSPRLSTVAEKSELGEESVNEPYLADEGTDDQQTHHAFHQSAFL